MKRLLCWLLLLSAAAAEQVWKIDLNGDGKPETIRLQPTNSSHGAWWVVVDGLWKSPDTLSDAGEGLPAVGDADGDGRVDLVVYCGTRGGPPSNFALYPWTGEGFEWRKKELKPLFESENELFVEDQPYRKGRYLEITEVLRPGHILANVRELRAPGDPKAVLGLAELKFTPQGYRVERWRVPFHPVGYVEDMRYQNIMRNGCRDQDLAGLSARELTLLRNTVYARHGRPFQDPQLRAYFAKQPYYKPNPAYNDAYLPPDEKALAQKIAAYQKRTGKTW
jgi:hypothetical protein